MAVSGVIAEFNPLHNGHCRLLEFASNNGENTVVCVLSGNFTQRGDTAIIPKAKRAEAALMNGADLVCELPVAWSMSTAQNFALGGVAQLMALGCEEIVFGSECGKIESLIKAAEILEKQEFSELLQEELSDGKTFAAARENAACKLGCDSKILSSPNDTLAVEYILAARKLGFEGTFRCMKRIGAAHDSKEINPTAVSASLMREHILLGDIAFAERFMPINLRGFISSDFVSNIKNIDKAILAVLRSKSKEEFSNLPDLSEGIENKFYFSLQVATDFDELCGSIKTKRYSMARIRRLVLSAFLGIDNTMFKTTPPYVRVLGFNDRGAEQLSVLESPSVPIVTRVSDIRKLDAASQKVFELECRATDLYALSLNKAYECGMEFKSKLLKF